MNDICVFLPPQNYETNLYFVHFVYETNIKNIGRTLSHTNYYINIVAKGHAVFKTENKEVLLKKGDLFFTFPNRMFYIDADDDFSFFYISFNGQNANKLLENQGIGESNCVFTRFEHLIDFWRDSIIRLTQSNATVLTESVLMYTLSFICNAEKTARDTSDKINVIIEYVIRNFSTKDISLKKLADIFLYSEKYLSALFAKRTGIKFTVYLNNLRIDHAKKLICQGEHKISLLSSKCGYSDSFYFSKVFKKLTGESPSQYIKHQNTN